jgi:hypothetical protein
MKVTPLEIRVLYHVPAKLSKDSNSFGPEVTVGAPETDCSISAVGGDRAIVTSSAYLVAATGSQAIRVTRPGAP